MFDLHHLLQMQNAQKSVMNLTLVVNLTQEMWTDKCDLESVLVT